MKTILCQFSRIGVVTLLMTWISSCDTMSYLDGSVLQRSSSEDVLILSADGLSVDRGYTPVPNVRIKISTVYKPLPDSVRKHPNNLHRVQPELRELVASLRPGDMHDFSDDFISTDENGCFHAPTSMPASSNSLFRITLALPSGKTFVTYFYRIPSAGHLILLLPASQPDRSTAENLTGTLEAFKRRCKD